MTEQDQEKEGGTEPLEEWLKNKELDQVKALIRENYRDLPKVLPAVCAEELEKLLHFYTDKKTEQLFVYHEDSGVWQPDGEQIIKRILEAQLRAVLSDRSVNEIIGHVKRNNYIDPEKLEIKNTLINFKNGVLDLETGQLLPHDQKYYFTNYLDIEWNPEPKVPEKTISFLADRAGGDDEKFISLLEGMAFPLIPDYRIHTAIMLVGETHRGKTTYLELLERIYGKENAAHLSMQQFSLAVKEHAFILTSLINKTINVADDLPDRPIEYTGLFKQLTGESPINAEIKFGPTISFYNRAKMYFSANKIPVAYENTDAFYGRWQIIELTKPIENEIPQELLMQELASKEELSNLLPLLVWIASKKLMKSTRFSFGKTPEQNATIYAKHSNTGKLYCETRLRVNSKGSILKAAIFSNYKQWCDKHGYLDETEKSFWSTLRSTFAGEDSVVERRKTTDGVTKRYYDGLEFVDESEDEDEEEVKENTPSKDVDLLKEYFGIENEQSSQDCQDCHDCQDFASFNYLHDIYKYYKEIRKNIVNPVNLGNLTPNSNTILDTPPQPPPSKPMESQSQGLSPNPSQPATIPAAPTPPLDTQTQANQQVFSPNPAGPAPGTHDAGTSTQTQQQAMVTISEPPQQQNAPYGPTPQQKEVLQRVFIAVKLSKGEAFWLDPEQEKPNSKLSSVLQGLSADVIQEALKSLQWQGYVYETRPNYWYTARDLHLVDVVYYNDPAKPVYCPSCGKPVSKLFWYGADWLCIDCLNELQHDNDYDEGY